MQPNGFCNIDAKTFQILITRKFVERECRRPNIAARKRNTQQTKIALQNTVFARRTVNGDVSKIERYFATVEHERKIVFVDRQLATID